MPKHTNLLTYIACKLYAVWFWCIFLCIALGTLCLITVIPGQERRRRIARSAAKLLFRLSGAYPTVTGLENLPATPSVVVANHASYMDGILLTAVLPHHYRFVIKREITKVPLVSFVLHRIGAHFVERANPQRGASDARRIMQTTTNGESLAMFPEGTFTDAAGLRNFHNGAFAIATRSCMPLVPLTILGTRHMLPAHQWLPRPARLTVIISEPLQTNSETTTLMAREHCRKSILSHLNEPDLMAKD
jgi:1-acyl-sn-glycerol-3-phosphate acyltransferase